jgi:hypothetical protein
LLSGANRDGLPALRRRGDDTPTTRGERRKGGGNEVEVEDEHALVRFEVYTLHGVEEIPPYHSISANQHAVSATAATAKPRRAAPRQYEVSETAPTARP